MTTTTKKRVSKPRADARYSLHVAWNPGHDRELLYCQAFRLLPHGFSKRVVVRMLDAIVGSNVTDPEKISRTLFQFLKAPDELARSAIVGAAPLSWQDPEPVTTEQAVSSTRPMQRAEFMRRQYQAPPPGWQYAMVPVDATREAAPQPLEPAPPAPYPPPQPAPDMGPQRHEVARAGHPRPSMGGLMGGPA